MTLQKIVDGKATSLASAVQYSLLDFNKFSLKVNGTSIKVWHDGNLKFNVTDSTFAAGGVAFSGASPALLDLKVGYDNNGDGDIGDAGDDLVVNTSFTSTSTTFAYDDAGNLVDDGKFVYTYDAWNRLVTVEASEDTDTKVADYEYDAKGRRIKKVVTNSGDLDGTELFYYNNRWQAIEVRDGSENVIRQVMHGTRYIDEIVAQKLENGFAFVHQDANWNVKVLTDFAGQVLERYDQTPYGIITVDQQTMFGDSDNDGFVKVADWDTNTNGSLDFGDTCWGSNPTGDCRLIDFDFDGDVDATDATTLNNLASDDTYRRPGLAYSVTVGNRRTHQGLVHDPDTLTLQDRHREYAPSMRRFMQRDPMGLMDGIADAMSERRIRYASMIAPLLGEWPLPPQAPRQYADGMNVYGYERLNPIKLTDPSGKCSPHPDCDDGSCDTHCCDMYLWNPIFYNACVLAGDGDWENCVRCCLQVCICETTFCFRWSAITQVVCHVGCFLDCPG